MKHPLAPLLASIGTLWFLMTFGVVWLLWHRQWRSATWLGAPMRLLFLLGSTSLVEMLAGGSISGVDGCEP